MPNALLTSGAAHLALAAVAWYAATLALVSAAGDGGRGGWRGIAQSVPLLAAVAWAAASGRNDLAVGAAFGAAAAGLMLGLGVMTSSTPPAVGPPVASGAWALALPAALVALAAGFGGRLTPLHAALFLIEAGLVAWVWREGVAAPAVPVEDPDRSEDGPDPAASGSGSDKVEANQPATEPPPQARRGRRAIALGLGLAVAVIAASWAVDAAGRAESFIGRPIGGAVAALIFGPAMVLPTLGTGAALAQRGRPTVAAGAQVAFGLIALCVGLPLAIGVAYGRSWLLPAGAATSAFASDVATVAFPPAAWRVDAVFLAAVGLLLAGAAAGRVRVGRGVGLALIFAYVVYINLAARAHA